MILIFHVKVTCILHDLIYELSETGPCSLKKAEVYYVMSNVQNFDALRLDIFSLVMLRMG